MIRTRSVAQSALSIRSLFTMAVLAATMIVASPETSHAWTGWWQSLWTGSGSLSASYHDNFVSTTWNMHLDPAEQNTVSCNATITLTTVALIADKPINPQVNFEVIDPLTWRYIALGHASLRTRGSQNVQTASWHPRRPDVVVRVSLLGPPNGAQVINYRDFRVTCTW